MRRGVLLVCLAACGGSAKPAPRPVHPSDQPGLVVLDEAPRDALVLDVRAVRWACTVTHARGVQTSDLVVPVGRAIELHVWTPEWPQAAKGLEVSLVGTDVQEPLVKDHPVDIAFRVDEPGTYQWRCPTLTPPPPELHEGVELSPEARQQLDPVKAFRAIAASEYEAMLAANDVNDPAVARALGATLYQKRGCVACHTTDGTPRIGPSWKGIWGTTVKAADGSTRTVDAAYIRDSLEHPQAFVVAGYPSTMPSFEGILRAREVTGLTAYIQSLQ